MILKQLLNSQALKLIKDFKKNNKEIFDIVIYGSAVRNKINFNDIDLAIIFSSLEDLDKKLTLSQKLRNNLKNIINYDFDVKGIDINDLLDSSFIAGKSIIAEGFLIIRKKFLHEILGFKNYYIFSYSLKNLKPSKKVMFQYALNGRRGEKGMTHLTGSIALGRGAIKVPLEHSEEFKDFFEKNKINYKINRGLLY